MGGGGGGHIAMLYFSVSYHSLTFVSGQMVVAGGENEIASVETLDGTEWVETNNLKG